MAGNPPFWRGEKHYSVSIRCFFGGYFERDHRQIQSVTFQTNVSFFFFFFSTYIFFFVLRNHPYTSQPPPLTSARGGPSQQRHSMMMHSKAQNSGLTPSKRRPLSTGDLSDQTRTSSSAKKRNMNVL